MSNASLNESESDLHFLIRRYGDRADVARATDMAVEVRKPLMGLVKRLRKKKEGER
jgi:hypothetical protein